MILVTGAAGKTGRTMIRALSEKKARVRAFIYRPEQRNTVESCGATEVVVGDMRDVDAFHRAAEGVKKIYHICPNVSPDEVEIGRVAISVSQATALDHFVYHSVLHPQTQKMPHHWSKLKVEELLLESELPFTILQPTIYMQNVLSEWERITQEGIYAIPYAVERELSMVDLEDVAEAAALVLTESGHIGATYELCGPKVMSAQQIAEILGEKLGRQINTVRTPIEEWIENAERSGFGEFQIKTLVKMFEYYDMYGFPGNEVVLRHLLKRTTTDFSSFVEKAITHSNADEMVRR